MNNSYKSYRSKANNIQLYKNKAGSIYLLEKGLYCAINNEDEDGCDEEIKVNKQCDKNGNCDELGKYFESKNSLGVVHQSQLG